MNNRITFVGDIHGEFSSLNKIIEKEKSDLLLQCGDFGIWPHEPYNTKYECPVYFCRGNHEWHDLLDTISDGYSYAKMPNLVNPGAESNLYLCNEGMVLHNKYGYNILFLGGAYSIDKSIRTPYKSWWPQEELTSVEYDTLVDDIKAINSITPIHIVVSHEAPTRVRDTKNSWVPFTDENLTRTPNRWDKIADILTDCFLWVHGHYHIDNDTVIKGRRYISLGIPFNKTEHPSWGYRTFTVEELKHEQDCYKNYIAVAEGAEAASSADAGDTGQEEV